MNSSLVAGSTRTGASARLRKWASLWVSVFILAGTGVWLWGAGAINDVAWQLWVGRQLAHGAELYVDIFEVNPPLWFWIAVPVVQLASTLGVTEYHAFLLLFGAVSLCSMLLVSALTKDMPGRNVLIASVPIATLLIGLDVFGQREQFTLIVTVPYVVLAGRRAAGQRCRIELAIMIGCLAAIGLALKPHFLIMPVAIELWLWSQARRLVVRPEAIALALCLAAYGAAVLLFAPDYLRTMVPMVALAYRGYESSLRFQLIQPVVGTAAIGALALILYGWPKSHIARASLLAGVAFLMAFLLQQKGWRYHSIPALGFFVLAVAAEAGCFSWRSSSIRQKASIALLALAFAAPMVALAWGLATKGGDNARRATQRLHPGDVVMVLSTSGAGFWPLPEERGFVWPSRHMTFWMLIEVAEDLRRPNPSPEILRLAARIRRDAAEDLLCHPPQMILVDGYNEKFLGFSLLTFFNAEPSFAGLLKSYSRGSDYGKFSTYTLSGGVPMRPKRCRTIY